MLSHKCNDRAVHRLLRKLKLMISVIGTAKRAVQDSHMSRIFVLPCLGADARRRVFKRFL